MKKFLLALVLSVVTVFGLVACGNESNTKDSNSSKKENKEETAKKSTTKQDDVYFKDDVLKIDMATVKLTGSEVIPPDRFEENSTLIITYEFTNDSEELLKPSDVFIACFTLTQETDTTVEKLDISMADLPEKYKELSEMSNVDIKPGATVKSEISYSIKVADKPVTMTASQGLSGKELGTKTYKIEKWYKRRLAHRLFFLPLLRTYVRKGDVLIWLQYNRI